jgi:hypothetical protein
LPKHDKSLIEGAICNARNAVSVVHRDDYGTYTGRTWTIGTDSLAALEAAIATAQTVYDTNPTEEATILGAVSELKAAVAEILSAEAAGADTAGLVAKIAEASAIEKSGRTESAFKALQTAIATAEAELNAPNLTVMTIANAITALDDAITTFKRSVPASNIDPNTLLDESYTVRVSMQQATNPDETSMADGSIGHNADLTVSGGAYYITLDLKGVGMTLFGSPYFGYLKDIYYYEFIGGAITGEPKPAVVLSYQEDEQGNKVTDKYNEGKGWYYPDIVMIPLPEKASYEDGLVPLQVFVPVMDAIEGVSGTQEVFLHIEWDTLAWGTVEDNGGNEPEIDKWALSTGIAAAKAIAQGKKSADAYAELKAAIQTAHAVFSNPGATQAQVDAALVALRAAIAKFNGSPNIELNQSKQEEVILTSLSTLKITAADKVWTGKKIASGFVLSVDGKKLAQGTDYTVAATGANKNIGKGTVQITGAGGYTDTVTVNFKIVPKAVKLGSVKAGKKALTVKWSKAPKAEKITKYELRYRASGVKSWKTKSVSAKSATLKISKLKKGKKYNVQLRAYKTVGGVKYYSAWSGVKTSGKVK